MATDEARFNPRRHTCADCVFFYSTDEEAGMGYCYRYPPKTDLLARAQTPMATLAPHQGKGKPMPSFQRICSVPQVWHQQFCGEGVLK